jgi:hypothetical protein
MIPLSRDSLMPREPYAVSSMVGRSTSGDNKDYLNGACLSVCLSVLIQLVWCLPMWDSK